jgi:adenosylcobinamide-GDP ribazoletransferase
MNNFLSALQFLTIIPIKLRVLKEEKLCSSMFYFPLVGLLLGMALVGINSILLKLGFEQFATSIILVVILTGLTGGLHLDGLSDTSDALLSAKSREEMLTIMRDSHIGAMGALAIICIVLLKISFLSSISANLRPISLILMCVLGRWSMVFSMFLFPYARKEGKAKAFIEGINFKILISAALMALACVFFTGRIKGVFIFMIVTAAAYLIAKFINHKLNGITGDTLGAINELTETLTLLSICIIEGTARWII